MTKSNNEWAPETFDEVEVWIDNVGYWAKVKVLAVDAGRVVWRNGSDGLSYIGTPLEFVRPVKTEAEKRRDERENWLITHIMEFADSDLGFDDASVLSKYLISLGYVQPKPLTEKAVFEVITVGLNCKVIADRLNAYTRGEA